MIDAAQLRTAQDTVRIATDGTSPMSAFRESVESMIPALRRYARALARDTDIADDLVQDTMVRALRSEKLFIGGDLRSWLYTILTNLNRNRRRSLARKPVFTELFDNNPEASGTEAEGRDISRALAALVEEQRSVLLLVMLEGLSYREVADIQGVPIGTVMSRLARARAHVKAYLDGERPALRAVK
jgi:RNA polymerase sigma-70 factor (ECF subfamily)